MGPLYCDRLCLGAVVRAARLAGTRRIEIRELDRPVRSLSRLALVTALRLAGISVSEARFFAGDLRTASGESVFLAARRATTAVAFRAVSDAMQAVPRLARLDADYGRHSIRLFLSRMIWMRVEHQVRQCLVADALGGEAMVLLRRSRHFDSAALTGLPLRARIVFYGSDHVLASKCRYVLGSAVVAVGAKLRLTRRAPLPEVSAGPALLMLQEDDLSLDRSYRTQPHWVPGAEPLSFPAYVVTANGPRRLSPRNDEIRELGMIPVASDAVTTARLEHPVSRQMASDAWASLRAALSARSAAECVALSAVFRLLRRAAGFASMCHRLGVTACLAGESYPLDADAMQVAAARLGVRTVTYQYSNLAFSTPHMLTTADTMVVFSPHYHSTWCSNGIAPRAFVDAGYVFDGAFGAVRARAGQMRSALQSRGARFVICYFDENVARHRDKYGLTSREHHFAEIGTLLNLLLEDPSVGIVVKSQFERNSPSRIFAGNELVERARRTGRYVELVEGVHRNIVFPAEAALASDIAIGHVVGATAPLEAACAGTRCVMLNPYGMATHPIYARARIVFPSIEGALRAIAQHRAGEPALADLGDWTGILQEFDPFRDGAAPRRLRAVIERAVFDPAPAEALAPDREPQLTA
ncbi:MAG: hypothetical protein IT176_14600 [Acidobacteria bacterium]|nr:hypothetical protein [Acidobacteriota bacterium]